MTWAFPLRLGGGADPAGAVYFHTGAGLQGMVRGERLTVGLRCEYVAGFGLGERLALIVWPVNLNVHVSHLF